MLIWNEGTEQEVQFNSVHDLTGAFNMWYSTGQKLQTVKTLKQITGLGLKEAKDWVDENWNPLIGVRIAKYLKILEPFNGTYQIKHHIHSKDYLQIQIDIHNNIAECDVDELIEEVTKQIIVFKNGR